MIKYITLVFSVIFISGLIITPLLASEPTETELRDKLKNQQSEISQLEKEIAEYKNKLNSTTSEKQTLQTELNRLQLTKKKLETDVRLTKAKITETETIIQTLSREIKTSEEKITLNQKALAESLRTIKKNDQTNLALIFLENKRLSDFLANLQAIETLHYNLKTDLSNLQQAKQTYESKKTTSEKEYQDLARLETELSDKRVIVTENQDQTNSLLTQTKQEESTYQALLADRLRKKEAVEAEILAAERALDLIVNPSSLPQTGRGVIKWPFDKVVITQYFGNTPFATTNPQIYKGQGHNGIDLGAPVGTPTKAVLDGVVIGTGDTDLTCPKASYGRWVMIKHPNGLSSVYGHLSKPTVTEGQTVKTGEVIAYSGNTGYTTGPHLHFTLMANDGSKVGSLQSKVPGCGVYRLPLATPDAILNPLSYL